MDLKILFAIFIAIIGCDAASIESIKILDNDCTNLQDDLIEEIAGYAPIVDKIINYYKNDFKGITYQRIVDFADKFGPRVTGSKSLEDSIDYMMASSDDLENVHTEEVEVLNWVRIEEKATLIKPRLKNLPLMGLGFSGSTPPEGITAQAIVVRSFDDLEALDDNFVKGKIVVYDQPFTTYEETSQYRRYGAMEASKKGAVAALIRSVTNLSMNSPHTGVSSLKGDNPMIPTAAITHEDADFLRREQERSHEIIINLKMISSLNQTVSRNFIAELKGINLPEKIVVVSGHIDSWDVGDGSMDDAGGCFLSFLAPKVLSHLNLIPKRTIRTILFTAEEQGLVGAFSYEEKHRNESDNLVFVMESDTGTFAPLGIMYQGHKDGECVIKEILKLFYALNATKMILEDVGPDVALWTFRGIPGGGFYNDNKEYFWYHHSEADNINILDPDTLDIDGAFWTAFTYIMADLSYEIPRTDPLIPFPVKLPIN